jgi:hypothetical protein
MTTNKTKKQCGELRETKPNSSVPRDADRLNPVLLT